MINRFIKDVCEILNIATPDISYDTSHFSSPTMMAQCCPDGNTIFIKHCDKPNPDHFFAVAHELRHVWQMQVDKHFYFDNYKPIDLISSVDEYNLQEAEIDANAFAGLVMLSFFKLQPQYQGLSDNVKQKILKRIDEIYKILS